MIFSNKNSEDNIPIHEMTKIGICLAIVGGFLDAYTYLYHGGVFANGQSGNLVQFGIALSNGNLNKAAYYMFPVFAFFLGVIVTEILKRKFTNLEFASWQHIVLVIEAILLLLIGFPPLQLPDTFVNVIVSFVCSMQVNSFRKIVGAPYTTTMCTGNLRSATEQLFISIYEHNKEAGRKSFRYFLIIISFCIGACIGAWLTALYKGKAVWFCSIIIFFVLTLMCFDKNNNEINKK